MHDQQMPIIYEDEDILVLNKPAGITVNRSDTTRKEFTVQDWTDEKLNIKTNTSQPWQNTTDYMSDAYVAQAFLARGGIVHRLDKETSGILLVAKNPIAFKNLQEQFRNRLVHKKYIALVHGLLFPAESEIFIPVDRLPWNRKKFGIVPGGRPSETVYKTLSVYLTKGKQAEELSLVELYPKTGRTHQIRVHMKYLNRPIFSDFLYAGRKTSRNDRRLLKRVFLHASDISFSHPITNQQMEFHSPLPQELQNFLNTLEIKHI